jgi:hypothetical protein
MIVPIVSSRPLAQILSQLNLRPIIRQRNTHQSPRLHAAIDARVAQRREHKLVDSEVQVSVLGNSELHNTSQRNPHNTHSLSPHQELTVSTQFNLGSLTNVFTVPLAGLKIDTAFCSMLPW